MDRRKNNKGGRKLGSENRSKGQARELIHELAHKRYGKEGFGAVVNKMFELIDGVEVLYTDKKGECTVYTEKPDAFAAKTLMEYVWGKAPQPMEHSGNLGVKVIKETI
jgi:hypothetical protein